MAALLSKFRIDFSDVNVISDIQKPPQASSLSEFESLITPWREKEESEEHDPLKISDSELASFKDKTKRHIRLRELLLQHSSDASLIVM